MIEATDGPEIVLAEQQGLDITVFGDAGRWRREDGWVSHCYGSREPARVYAYSAQTSGNQRFVTFLLPRVESRSFKVREVEAIGGKAFAVTHENGIDIVMIRAGASEQVEMERLASNFAWTWVSFTDTEGSVPAELILLDGSRLNIEGRQVLNSERHVRYLTALRQGNRFVIDTEEQRGDCLLQIENFVNAPVKS